MNNPIGNELFVWHEAGGLTTTSRFYFRETLNRKLFENRIKSPLLEIFLGDAVDAVFEFTLRGEIVIRGYAHNISIQWLNDVTVSNRVNKQFEKHLEEVVDPVLNQALGWRSSVLRQLDSYEEVKTTSTRFGQDWRKGQFSL